MLRSGVFFFRSRWTAVASLTPSRQANGAGKFALKYRLDVTFEVGLVILRTRYDLFGFYQFGLLRMIKEKDDSKKPRKRTIRCVGHNAQIIRRIATDKWIAVFYICPQKSNALRSTRRSEKSGSPCIPYTIPYTMQRRQRQSNTVLANRRRYLIALK